VADPLVEAYILLGLRLGRHVDGLVDAYYGPSELKERVDSESLADAAALVEQGDALLEGLEDGWLRDQGRGLRTYAGVLAGEKLSYSDEVEGCYGVRPERTSPDVYEAVHGRLEELLPGAGPLADRYRVWREQSLVSADLVPALLDVAAELRGIVSRLVELPDGEWLDADVVHDEPWGAFNYYRGNLRSRVVVNVDDPWTFHEPYHLVCHEIYPGHHTERAVKEKLLVDERGHLEETILLVTTPGALVAEGIAEAGPLLIWDRDPGLADHVGAIARRHGVEYDVANAQAVAEARLVLRGTGVDAALMIHEDGATEDEATAYRQRWSLLTAEQAANSIRFLVDPTWRAYAITYVAGRELCAAWMRGDPARLRRLLTEHVRVGELASGSGSAGDQA
jgi:hypothetical protein